MKKIYSTLTMLAMMVAALSFTACGGDDDEIDNGGDASIVGTWECTYYDFGTDHQINLDDSDLDIGDRICFKSDGTYYTSDNETGRWSQKGKTLTVAVDDEISIPFDYKITELTSTTLEFYLDLGFAKLLYRFKRVS